MDSSRRNELKQQNPCVNSNAIFYCLYTWTFRIFSIGNKRDLTFTDLYEPLSEHSSGKLATDFTREWDYLLKIGRPSLFKTILRCFKYNMLLNLFGTCFVECVIRVSQCIFLGKMVSYFIPNQSTITHNQLLMYASGVIICSFLNTFTAHPCGMSIVHLCMKFRVGCCALIYRKALKLSKMAMNQTTVGQIVNLLSNDVGRFDVGTVLMNYLIVAPLQVITIAFLMWWEFGISGIVGIIVLILFIPFQIWLGKHTSTIRKKTAKFTDSRLKMMNELILGIHIIKMYAWELPFSKLMKTLRENEMNSIKRTANIKTLVLSFTLFNARFALFTSILAYVLLGNVITAEKIFILVSFYGILKNSLAVLFPTALTMMGELSVTFNRLETFLLHKENDLLSITADSDTNNDLEEPLIEKEQMDMKIKGSIPFFSNNSIKNIKVNWNNGDESKNLYEEEYKTDEYSLVLNNVSVKWVPENLDFTLNSIRLKVKPGNLVAIVGPVGSGKSSLFYTILQEIPIINGTMTVNGNISYASQEPWLFDSTITDNIIFGDEMNKIRYRDALKLCALDHDITVLDYGDKTLVGERGVTLSGGQKSRINLARSIYKDADIYLLDDPLSAVDVHVAKQIFDECIVKYLRGKTRLLITHQPQFLNQVDHIVVMKDGFVLAQGKYEELKDNCMEFNNLILSQTKNYDKVDNDENEDVEVVEKNDKTVDVRS